MAIEDKDEKMNEPTPIENLRNEMQQQFQQMKTSFESMMKEKDEHISKLESENTDLQRALVRSAFTESPKEEAPLKSDEELYDEEIQKIYNKSKEYMKFM